MKVLKKWEEVGASDPETLSKVLQRQSLGAVVTIVIQALLDAGAAYGGIYLGNFLAQADRIPLHWVWSFGASFVGSYFAVGVVLDLFTLGMSYLSQNVVPSHHQCRSRVPLLTVELLPRMERAVIRTDEAVLATIEHQPMNRFQNLSLPFRCIDSIIDPVPDQQRRFPICREGDCRSGHRPQCH